MLYVPASVAARIEHAEASLMSGIGDAIQRRVGPEGVSVTPVGGGVAVMAGPGVPWTKVAGLGFAPLDEEAIAAVEEIFARAGAAVRVELSSLAAPEAGMLLSARGYVLSGFENVLGRRLPTDTDAVMAPDPSIVVSQTGAADADTWLTVVATGFLHPDVFDGPPATETTDRRDLDNIFGDLSRMPGFSQYLARREGDPAGGASMRIDAGIAQLCGAATLPAHRRRGVQTTLLRERLARAAAAGCDLAVVTTAPGSKSQENVQRQGFELLYVRAVLLKSS